MINLFFKLTMNVVIDSTQNEMVYFNFFGHDSFRESETMS
jgi:hypothetical protein